MTNRAPQSPQTQPKEQFMGLSITLEDYRKLKTLTQDFTATRRGKFYIITPDNPSVLKIMKENNIHHEVQDDKYKLRLFEVDDIYTESDIETGLLAHLELIDPKNIPKNII